MTTICISIANVNEFTFSAPFKLCNLQNPKKLMPKHE